ncbi:MAG: ABC transporter permease [Candidatus Micrarchaeota archaeon]|nr:ABC transporter permease [Candidatus Micrarchaeota archaeon]
MKLIDMLIYSIKYLRTQKLRSWLTIIGIVIGVATIVALVSVGEGVKRDIDSQMSQMGDNLLLVVPVNIEGQSLTSLMRTSTAGKLYERDYEKIMSTPGVSKGARLIIGRTTISYKGKSLTSPVYAIDRAAFDAYPDYLAIESGRYYEDHEKNVVVLGYDAANEMFGKDKVSVNSIIQIGGQDFRVVGILKEIGTSLSTYDDLAIYVPVRAGRDLFKSTVLPNEITIIYALVEKGYDINLVKERVEAQLDANHRVNEDTRDYSVITPDFIKKTVDNVTGTLTLFLLLISSVSAFVGGIGISNTMFMSVLDRTREIGVLKSLGAKRGEILMLFIIEASIIGLIGGIIGCAIGWGAASFVASFGISTYVNPVFLGTVLFFSMLVGAVAGVIPAYNASKIPAVQALSY